MTATGPASPSGNSAGVRQLAQHVDDAVEPYSAVMSTEQTSTTPQEQAEAKAGEPQAAEPTSDPPTGDAVPSEGVVPVESATTPGNLGIWAFVLAMLGIVGLLPIVGSVVGFILGRVAIRQADTRRLRGGRGLAIAAVTISVITLVVIALSIAAYALAIAYLEV